MFDFAVILIVGLSTAFAAFRGGLRELSTLLALAVAGGLTLLLMEPLAAATGQSGKFVGMAVIIVVLMTVLFVAAHVGMHFGLQRVRLSDRGVLIDRVAGGAFGFLRGLVLIGLGYLGYSYYMDEARQPDSVRNAITRPVAAGVASWFQSFAPDSAYIESDVDLPTQDDQIDPAAAGYGPADRSGLNEIVDTATTSEPPAAKNASDDPIADLLVEDNDQ